MNKIYIYKLSNKTLLWRNKSSIYVFWEFDACVTAVIYSNRNILLQVLRARAVCSL